jgi:AraC-like DNA-binding protein
MVTHSSGEPDCAAPDALSDVLQDLRLSGTSYCRSEFHAPFGVQFPAEEGAVFHFVAEGGSWLRPSSDDPGRLEAGDVALLPRGAGHALLDRLDTPTKRIRDVHREHVSPSVYRLRAGGSGGAALLVCCAVRFEAPAIHPLLELMPEVLHVRGSGSQDPSLPSLLDAMATELTAQRVGAATVMARLADIVITRLVRAWAESRRDETTGWLAAIRDPQIGRALAAFHRRPHEAWSVASLAAAAHQSRSLFSDRFTAVLGMPPARYVARWRVHLAGNWLRHERVTIAEVAARLGYESEPSFSRAFKRFMGASPADFRRGHSCKPRRTARAGTRTRSAARAS